MYLTYRGATEFRAMWRVSAVRGTSNYRMYEVRAKIPLHYRMYPARSKLFHFYHYRFVRASSVLLERRAYNLRNLPVFFVTFM